MFQTDLSDVAGSYSIVDIKYGCRIQARFRPRDVTFKTTIPCFKTQLPSVYSIVLVFKTNQNIKQPAVVSNDNNNSIFYCYFDY